MSNAILGEIVIKEPQILADFVKRNNPNFDKDIATAFLYVGGKYGIRGDVAFCQSIIETGWFKFADGTAVTPDQHNYCGMGVTQLGLKGNSFSSIVEGVTAQVQHLYAYASTLDLTEGVEIVDPRFKYVHRGIAPNWEDLGGKWSSQKNYGEAIIHMYANLYQFAITHPLFVTGNTEQEKETIIINKGHVNLRIKEFDSEALANNFLEGKIAEDIVQITPFMFQNSGIFRYSITYKERN